MLRIAILFPDGSLNVHAPSSESFADRLKDAREEAASANTDVAQGSDLSKVVLVDVQVLETVDIPID